MLIPCPLCGKQVSDTANSCIHCGNPLAVIEHANSTPTKINFFSLSKEQ